MVSSASAFSFKKFGGDEAWLDYWSYVSYTAKVISEVSFIFTAPESALVSLGNSDLLLSGILSCYTAAEILPSSLGFSFSSFVYTGLTAPPNAWNLISCC